MTRADAILSSSLAVACLAGAGAAWLPWHSLGYGLVEVTGVERPEGRVLAAALALAAALEVLHLLGAGGALRARLVVAATSVATGSAAAYVYVMARKESALHELVRKGLDGMFRPGIAVASLATLTALALALWSWKREARTKTV